MSPIPILIYLDSQDFIRLTDERNNKKVEQVWRYLRDKQDKKEIEMPISWIHIIEILNPDSPDNMVDQRSYGETIEVLMGGAMPHMVDLINGYKYPNDNIWMPREVFSDFKSFLSKDFALKIIKEQIAIHKGLSRKCRNKLKSKRQLERSFRNSKFDINDNLTLLGISENDIRNMIVNQARARKTVFDKIMRKVTSPSSYSDTIAFATPGTNPIRDKMDEIFEPMYQSVLGFFKEYEAIFREKKELIERFQSTISNQAKLGNSKTVRELTNDLSELKKYGKIESIRNNPPLDSERFRFLDIYLPQLVRVGVTPLRSEVRDLFHLTYIPDVDLLRVDRRMAEVMKSDKEISEKLVAKLTELPNRIEFLLEKGSRNS